MISQALIQLGIIILSILFSWTGVVDSLPSIGGYNLDSALVGGVAMFQTYADSVWPIRDVFIGFGFMLTYYTIKMILKFFLGHRAPGRH